MSIRVPKHTVITTRNKKIVHAHAGKPFDFTDEEIEDLTDKHGSEFLKKHMVEVEDEPTRAGKGSEPEKQEDIDPPAGSGDNGGL